MNFLAYTWRNRHPHITAAIAHIRYKIIFRNQAHLDAALKWANDNTTDFAVQWTHTGNITKVLLRAR